MLTQNARIVNVSSRAGLLKILESDSLKHRVDGVSNVQEVDALADEFVQVIKGNKCVTNQSFMCNSTERCIRSFVRHKLTCAV